MRQEITFYKVAFVFFLWCLSFSLSAGVEWVEQTNHRAEIMALSEQVVKNKLGRELRFSERIGLRLVQRQVRKQLQSFQRNFSDCTRIVLHDGSIIEASRFVIESNYLTYTPCGLEDESNLKISLRDVLSIVDDRGIMIYRNGRYTTHFEHQVPRTNWYGIVSIILGVASVIFLFSNPLGYTAYLLALFGISFGIAGYTRKSKNFEIWTPLVGLLISSIPFLFQLFLIFFGLMLFGLFL